MLVGVGWCVMCVVVARATYTNKQTDQTTTLCVQEVEIYLERWEVLGALVDVSVGKRAREHLTLTCTTQYQH